MTHSRTGTRDETNGKTFSHASRCKSGLEHFDSAKRNKTEGKNVKKGLSLSAKNDDRVTDKAADVERSACDEPLASSKGAAFNSRVRITVVSYRCRLADADGISAKAAIDGLVHCGILRDDSAKEVGEVCYRQHKVKNEEEEKTLLEIEEMT